MELRWKAYTSKNVELASSECFCLYVYHHPADGDRPFYIGKAKYFGTRQADGYKASARYNSGYSYLIEGMLRAGYTLYVAAIGPDAFADVEAYEQELIAQWQPIRPQRVKALRRPVQTQKPWLAPNNSFKPKPLRGSA
jgi:hypothetical protein